MKINRLIIKNINSLAGEHTIDFDEINEKSDGVYLIVGATGSGKTTILDSITLGLFGAVKRLGDISAGNIEKTGSIITHGARDARVDVQFTVKGQQYTVRWEIRHKVRSAGWDQAKMSLYDVNDQLIESGLSTVRKKLIEIIGMNFDQFNKSILLAQGDFASFLKSKFTEKADILEKITGTEYYSKIGKAIFDKNTELKAVADLLNSTLFTLSIKSDDEVVELKARRSELKKKVNDHLKQVDRLNNLLSDLKNYALETKQIGLIKDDLLRNQAELESIKSNHGDQIKSYDAALGIQTTYDQHKILSTEIVSQEQNKLELIKEKLKYEDHQTLIFEKANTVFQINKNAETFLSQIRNFKEEVRIIDDRLKEVESAKNSCHKSLKIEIERIKDHDLINALLKEDSISFNLNLSNRLTKLNTEIKTLKAGLNTHEVTSDLLDIHQNDLGKALSLQTLSEKYKEFIFIIKKKEESFEKNEAKFQLLTTSIQNKSVLEINLSKTLNDKWTILQQQRKIMSMEQHRHKLADGEDCPLCGAADGPLRHQSPKGTDEYETDYENAKNMHEDHKKQLIREEAELESITRTNENIKSEIADHNKQKDLISSDIQHKKSELEITESLKNEQVLVSKINDIKLAINSIKTILKHQETLPYIKQAIVCNEEKAEAEKEERQIIVQLKEKFPFDISIKEWAAEHENAFETNRHHIRNTEQGLSGVDTLLKRNQIQVDILSNKINDFIRENHLVSASQLEEIFALKDKAMSWKKSIETHQQQINTNESILKLGLERLADLEKRIDLNVPAENYEIDKQVLNEKITTESQELGAISSQISQHEENVSKGEQLKHEIDKIEESWKPIRILNNLIGSATGHHFKNIAQKQTLSLLAILANKHLSLMNDRYKFKFDTKELWSKEEADLMIYDDFDPNGLRSCATLSGGETFIASLALALGLSDFASESNKIESLFIDEGFGTLDPDTLEMAISALDKIRYAGKKTLCLITHVEAMKDRIPYHLVVEKGRRGTSTIRFDMAG